MNHHSDCIVLFKNNLFKCFICLLTTYCKRVFLHCIAIQYCHYCLSIMGSYFESQKPVHPYLSMGWWARLSSTSIFLETGPPSACYDPVKNSPSLPEYRLTSLWQNAEFSVEKSTIKFLRHISFHLHFRVDYIYIYFFVYWFIKLADNIFLLQHKHTYTSTDTYKIVK